ncbi:MAG TPA: hypothetical protein VHD62_14515 [Opitutaceae bacterium]|nr:hypothetical protein [Opitutaceae bacterium]
MKFRHVFVSLAVVFIPALRAWDFQGHRLVNELALASLPKDFPAFVHEPANAARIAFLSGQPDRWRNVDPWLEQTGPSWEDHFLDIEQLYFAGLDPRTVSSFRFDFVVQFAAARAAHADKFRPVDAAKNVAHTFEWPGFAPWAIAEWYQKLRSAFSEMKAYQEVGGTPEEIANAQANAVYVMGILGHYVGDCAQPLHTTIHHNGWSGENPNGYSTWPGLHAWIDGKDGGFIAKAGIGLPDLQPRIKVAEPLALPAADDGRDPFFSVAMDYIIASNELVEPLYRLEKAGKFSEGKDAAVTPEGRAFIEDRLLAGGQMLGRMWETAWRTTPVDTYLRTQLAKRIAPANPASPAVPPANAAK